MPRQMTYDEWKSRNNDLATKLLHRRKAPCHACNETGTTIEPPYRTCPVCNGNRERKNTPELAMAELNRIYMELAARDAAALRRWEAANAPAV